MPEEEILCRACRMRAAILALVKAFYGCSQLSRLGLEEGSAAKKEVLLGVEVGVPW